MWPFSRPPRFPPVTAATPEGLLLLGGELSPDWLLDAYRRGIFPWPIVEEDWREVAWFAPDPRAILEFDDWHVSRRLARRMRSGGFTMSHDRDFAGVMSGCAAPRRQQHATWITPELATAFTMLHELGVAHSVEVWDGEELVGGVYGIALGGYFSAESMFSRRTDASKMALACLINRLQERGFQLLDIQVLTPHTARLGAKEISRAEFMARLAEALASRARFS